MPKLNVTVVYLDKAWIVGVSAGLDLNWESREKEILLWFHYWVDSHRENVFKRSNKRPPLRFVPIANRTFVEDNSWHRLSL
jgi:hypothetical protein